MSSADRYRKWRLISGMFGAQAGQLYQNALKEFQTEAGKLSPYLQSLVGGQGLDWTIGGPLALLSLPSYNWQLEGVSPTKISPDESPNLERQAEAAIEDPGLSKMITLPGAGSFADWKPGGMMFGFGGNIPDGFKISVKDLFELQDIAEAARKAHFETKPEITAKEQASELAGFEYSKQKLEHLSDKARTKSLITNALQAIATLVSAGALGPVFQALGVGTAAAGGIAGTGLAGAFAPGAIGTTLTTAGLGGIGGAVSGGGKGALMGALGGLGAGLAGAGISKLAGYLGQGTAAMPTGELSNYLAGTHIGGPQLMRMAPGLTSQLMTGYNPMLGPAATAPLFFQAGTQAVQAGLPSLSQIFGQAQDVYKAVEPMYKTVKGTYAGEKQWDEYWKQVERTLMGSYFGQQQQGQRTTPTTPYGKY